MATKNTAKRVAAVATLRDEKGNRYSAATKDSESLYAMLETMGYWWDSSAGAWVKGKPPSASMFEGNDGEATGVVRLRIMGHPTDLEKAIARAKKAFRVAEVSDKLYPNRKGPGYRAYLTVLFREDDDA